MRWSVCWGVAVIIGCTPAPAEKATAASAQNEAGVRPDEYGPPEPIRVDVIASVCKEAQCSGKLAEVQVWRTGQGKVARYVHVGDITSCSHSPTTVFDATGKNLGVIPMQAVTKGSEEEKRFTALKASLYGDNRHVETADCTARVIPR
jgi:hypothetical protein